MKNAAGKLAPVGLLSVLAASAALADAAALKALDTDNDGTVSLTEARAGASKVFADTDKDGMLRAKELKDRLDAAVVGTLEPKQYAKIVQSKFKAADTDNDGTLDEAELSSPAGAALLKLIQ